MKKALFITICATLVAVSCTKVFEQDNEILQPEETASSAIQTLSFSLVFDPETRVTIDSDGKTGWEIGDEILIHGEYINKIGYSVVVTLDGVTNKISADGKTASITITTGTGTEAGTVKPYIHTSGTPAVQDYTSTLYAIYPASAVTDGEHHSYYNNQFKETNTPLMLAYDDGEGHFVFRNLCSMITFTMPNTEDFDYYIFSGNNNEAVSYDTYAAVYAKYSSGTVKNRQGGNYDSSKTTGPKTSISGTVTCDGTTINRIFIPGLSNGDDPSLGITFSNGFTIEFVKNGDVTKKVSTNNSLTLAVGEYLPLGDISSHLKSYSRPAHASALSSTNDLSGTAKGPANCYIVNAGDDGNANKVFKFRQYIGNTTTAISRVFSVELLWETFNNTTKPNAHDVIAQVDYDSEYIYFKMPSSLKAGNALIAARDIFGEILWSWHIWVPSSDVTSSTYGGISHVQMMSRNLGALCDAVGDADTDTPIGSYGLYYVWGRKDPFPGPGTLTGSSAAAVSGTYGTRSQVSSTDIRKYPNYFIITGGDSTDAQKDWSTDHNNSLWGAEKQISDPCPPGWKVPTMSSGVSGIWDSDLASKTSLAGWASSTSHHWFKFGVDYDSDHPTTTGYVYFPYAGYLTQNNATYDHAGDRAQVLSATYVANSYASCLYAAPNAEFQGWQRKGRAGSIRCVAE